MDRELPAAARIHAARPDARVAIFGGWKLRAKLGENGYHHVKQNFLLTRQVKDYMLVMLALDHPDEDIVNLW